ncbi:MAG TPA: hypothetical protein VGG71_05330 [Chitinophagaceae bacterium]|jgi:hypothetical protein
MELNVRVEGDDAIADATDLKDFLDTRGAAGLEEVEMGRTVHKEGEQGLGSFIGNLVLKLVGDESIKGVIALLNKWAEQHDKRIHLPNGVIIPPNTLSPEQIVELATKLQAQSVK